MSSGVSFTDRPSWPGSGQGDTGNVMYRRDYSGMHSEREFWEDGLWKCMKSSDDGWLWIKAGPERKVMFSRVLRLGKPWLLGRK